MNERIIMPVHVDEIIRRLEVCGHNGYIVGGCVRDSLMGITPHDYDITTDSTPDETATCLDGYRIIRTGLKHGTLTVVAGGENVEITTHRVDGVYSDNRHPDKVTFTRKLEDDLNRRDFTVNAMAYSNRTGIVDLNSGIKHIREKIIMCVGDSDKRFLEDGLRILRALRFAGVLGFAIEEETDKAIRRKRELLRNISAERIFSEFQKIICGKDAGRILSEYDEVFFEIIPEILRTDMHRLGDIYNNTVSDRYVRLAILLRVKENLNNNAYTAEFILRRLKADNHTIQIVCDLLSCFNTEIGSDEKQIRHLLSKLTVDRVRQLIEMRRAVFFDNLTIINELKSVEVIIDKIVQENACISLKTLAVNGSDITAMGIKRGPEIGRILDQLLKMVIEGEVENEKNKLLNMVLTFI
ncbi:MAG: CCA tRNA nucleotidyltransferase [Eubacteriales bacterium]